MTTIWLSLGLALLVGCAWLFTATSARGMGRPSPAKSGVASPATNALTIADVKGLDRAAIRVMLKRLATTPPPPDICVTASCYAVALPPDRAEYVCPFCSEKTLYTKELVGEVEYTLPYCRQIVREIQAVVGQAVKLDESTYCRRCRPQITQPKLMLIIHYNDGTDRVLSQVTPMHLRELQVFLKGDLKLDSFGGEQHPLQPYLPHLETMLGEKAAP